jgi:hypothetical protein
MPPSTITASSTAISKQLRYLDERIKVLSDYAGQLETVLFNNPIAEIPVGSDAYFKFAKLYLEILKVTQEYGTSEHKAVELLMKLMPKPAITNREADEMYAMLKSMKPDELSQLKQAYLFLTAPESVSNAASMTAQAQKVLDRPPKAFAMRKGIDGPEITGEVIKKGRGEQPSIIKDSEGQLRLVFPDMPDTLKEPPVSRFADTLLEEPDDELNDLSAFFMEVAPE